MRLRAGLGVLGLSMSAFGAVTACGLSAVGTGELLATDEGGEGENGPDGGATPPGPGTDSSTSTGDGGGDADLDAPVVPDASACTATGTACSTSLPAGWTPLAFASSRNAACPGGYTAIDLVSELIANADACTCGCQIAPNDPPTCASGSFVSVVGSSSCSGNGQTFTVNGTGCTPLAVAGGVSAYGRYAAFALDRGTCTSTAVKDASKLASTAVRACVPPASCVEDVCLGTTSAIGPYGSCIVHDGDVPCPAGTFADKTLAGASAALTCGGCATCQNNATCGAATVRFYGDGACATQVASRVANDVCNPLATGAAGNNATHFRYDVATNNPTCAPTSTPTVAVGLEAPRTICCR